MLVIAPIWRIIVFMVEMFLTTAPREQGLEIKMTTILYSAIRPATGQTVADVIRRARDMGYTLTIFNGWTDDDIGPSGMPGPRRAEVNSNGSILREIQDACEVVIDGASDFPHIIQTAVIPDGYIVA